MKKTISLLTLCIFFQLLSGTEAKAQKEQGEIAINAGVGWSLVGALFSAFTSTEVESFASPVWNATADYGLSDKFSLGVAFGYQTMGLSYSNYQYYNSNSVLVSEDFKWTLSRMNLAVRPLLHWGNSEDLDMYAGVRAGLTKWSTKTETSDPDFIEASISQGGFGFQLLFGTRYYFSDVLGINFEVGLGSPYLIEGGLALRL